MRRTGIDLMKSIELFGLRDGISFWFRWNIADEIKIFYLKTFKHKRPPYFVKGEK